MVGEAMTIRELVFSSTLIVPACVPKRSWSVCAMRRAVVFSTGMKFSRSEAKGWAMSSESSTSRRPSIVVRSARPAFTRIALSRSSGTIVTWLARKNLPDWVRKKFWRIDATMAASAFWSR